MIRIPDFAKMKFTPKVFARESTKTINPTDKERMIPKDECVPQLTPTYKDSFAPVFPPPPLLCFPSSAGEISALCLTATQEFRNRGKSGRRGDSKHKMVTLTRKKYSLGFNRK